MLHQTITIMNDQKTLRQQLAMWEAGEAEHCHGFFDWFCSDRSLANRANRLQSNVRTFLKAMAQKGKPVDLDKHYVFFKNNCPMSGNIYDSFSICQIEEGNVQFWVTPRSGHRSANGQAEIWIRETDQEISAPSYRKLLAKL